MYSTSDETSETSSVYRVYRKVFIEDRDSYNLKLKTSRIDNKTQATM